MKLTFPPCFLVSSMFRVVLVVLLAAVLQQASRSCGQASQTAFNNKTDESILMAFRASLSNQRGALVSWNTTTDFCRWQGVRCSLKYKHRIVELNLSSQGLAGTVNPSIGNLTFLKILDLSSNNLHGEIPSAIGRLSQLRYLDLSSNSFHGAFHANLKNSTSLESINLDSNKLTGEIPAWLGGLSRLKAVRLQKNNFTGIIPQSLGNLSELQEINFISNKLAGPIPEGLGRLRVLEFLMLSENHLSGTIPAALFNLSSLTHISLATNKLHGILPSDMGNRFRKLQRLHLAINHFTGSIPVSLANATEINSLDISMNNFTGRVPPEIGKLCPDFFGLEKNQLVATTARDWKFMTFLTNCSHLLVLDLQDNMLGGMLPRHVSNLSEQLQVLYLGFNEISGTIPFGIGNLVGLTQLQLNANRFTGVLPNCIGRLNSLQYLGFHDNRFTGFMPSSLGNLTKLVRLYTSHNMFEGPLPTTLGSLQAITAATFNNNKFTGSLPIEMFNISSLSYGLDLSDNYFVGPLPPEVGGLAKLSYLFASRNSLSGPLPDALGNCQSLIDLELDSNFFNGTIPESISQMRGLIFLNLTENRLSGAIPQALGLISGLQEFYVSHNNLSGHIPGNFENMTSLYKLDLSFNHLDGEVPTHGVFSNMTGFLLDGNVGLCGGIPELHLPECHQLSVERSKRTLHLIFKVIFSIAGIALCISVALIYISFRKEQKAQPTTLIGLQLMDVKYPRVSYAELVQGTNNFDINNLVGTGRYASVYKCSLLLQSTMSTVAVKVFDLKQSGSSNSFIAECEALNKIRHRNLISVITCCSSSDSNQNDFKALVFEFMPNGSLHSWIHLDEHSSQQQRHLTLVQRLNIVVDVADALDYLHNNCDPPIVHCDLKPSNILLNQDLVAQVGDFGLAKILSKSETEQLINSKITTGIRGTIGYVAPEYVEGGQVSPYGDVYSFGIIILELFTGMAPTNDMFRDGLTLKGHAENALAGTLIKIVDPVLLSIEASYSSSFQGGRNAVEALCTVMLSITKLALSCSKQAPAERMCMRDAAAEVRGIRDHYVKRRQAEEVIMQ